MKFCDERIQKHLLNGGKIRKRDIDVVVSINKEKRLNCDCSSYYILTQYDLTADDWEIVESEYNWDKIIKDKILCVFSHQENFEYKMISILSKKDEDNDYYFTSQGTRYRYCKPFNTADFNIAEDLKEYEK